MADDEKFLKVIVQYVSDQGTLADTSTGAKGLQASLKAVEQQAVSARAQLMQLRAVARELNQVATLTIAAGTALSAPFIAAAAKYVSAMGQMETTSSDWLAAMEKIKRSTNDIGRVAAAALLPALQEAAGVSAQ